MSGSAPRGTRHGAAAAARPSGASSVPVMSARVILRTFGPFLRPQWPGCVLAGLLAVAGTGVALLKPWPLKYLFDEVLLPTGDTGGQDVQRILALVVVALAGIAVLDSLIGAARSYVQTVVGERVAAAIRTKLYDHLQRLPLGYHERTPTGELTTRLTGDVDKVRALLTVTLVDAATNVLTLAGMAGVLLVLDWQLSVALLLVLPLLLLTVSSFRARIRTGGGGLPRDRGRPGGAGAGIFGGGQTGQGHRAGGARVPALPGTFGRLGRGCAALRAHQRRLRCRGGFGGGRGHRRPCLARRPARAGGRPDPGRPGDLHVVPAGLLRTHAVACPSCPPS